MNKLFLLLCTFFAVAHLSTTSVLAQTVVTFDDILLNNGTGTYLQNDYQGLVWSNFAVANGILNPRNFPYITNGFYYGVVSSSNVALNAGGDPAEIDSPGTNFDFLSAYFTGGWNSNLNIEVQGFRDTNLVYDQTVVASAMSPTLFTFDYLDIDRLYFNTSGGQIAFTWSGGAQFAMDNFEFEFIPEPSSLLLAVLGAVTLFAVVRRKRA